MSALVVGMSHHTAPVTVLERAALSADAVEKLLADVHSAEHICEAVAVVTCNRVELYADVATFHGGVEEISSLLARHVQADLAELTSHLYVHYEDAAVSHLFHVASGLDSMVVGESQILGQVREAYRRAQAAETVGRVLQALFPAALRVGKRCHAETGIDSAGRSVVTVGLAAVAPAGVAGSQALVVGAGSMAALAASTLVREGANVVVASRSADRAERLAGIVGGRAIELSRLSRALVDVDVVVSCTGAAEVVLSADMVEAAVRERDGRPLRVLDVALPRDVDLAVHALPGVVAADLATLAGRHDLAAAAEDVAAVRAIVADELAAYAGARRRAQVAPTVVALRAMADDVVASELARMGSRLPDLDARALEEITKTVRRVVDKLLHVPTVRIKELAAEPGGASYESALRELFALDPRAVEAVVRPTLELDEGDVR
ncbi:MAG TPA: glutamyl-tRNA reductase [Jiangellaceae bacterium]|nr:glutamyl-tRNA reductase [Jiangellaceae bacterium]